MQQCCMQLLTYTMQQSCMQLLLHGNFNIHDATKLHATVACNFVASCMVGFRRGICGNGFNHTPMGGSSGAFFEEEGFWLTLFNLSPSRWELCGIL